jgi:hypothetical protein
MSATTTGLLADNVSMMRPMRNAPPLYTRPPNPGLAPIVSSATSLGLGGGAGIGANSDSAWGIILVRLGIGATGGGLLGLTWPVAPPVPPIVAADWAIGLAIAGSGPLWTISWLGLTQDAVPSSKPLRIAYQWRVAR